MPVRVLVVDDSVVFRQVLQKSIESIDGCECVGVARDGEDALAQIAARKPDVVTLDVEMPRLDGIGVLRALQQQGYAGTVIMVSALTRSGSQATVEALSLGAFDVVAKPDATLSPERAERQIRGRLESLILAVRARRARAAPSAPAAAPRVFRPVAATAGPFRPRIIAIGISTGGPRALPVLLEALPADLGVPIAIVQHMPPMFTRSLAESLDARCRIRVAEAAEGDRLQPGHAYIAPGGMQMKLEQSGADVVVRLTDDPPEKGCKPSADYLFRSVARCYGGDALGLIMTGMGSDGTLGLMLMKRQGARVLGQDEASCAVYGMPREAREAGVVDQELPLSGMADAVLAQLRGRA